MTSSQLSESVADLYHRRRFREAYETGVDGLRDGEDVLSRGETVRTQRWVGLSAVAMGRIDDAVAHLELAHEWDPTDLEVAMPLGELLFDEGRFDEGWDVLEAVLLHHRDQLGINALRDVCTRLAESYLSAGNPAAAVRRLSEVKDAGAGDPKVLEMLATAYERIGELSKAVAILRADLDDLADLTAKAARAIQIARLMAAGDDADPTELLENVAFEIGQALDRQPRRLELFETQTELLEAASAWTSLHAAYVGMIARLDATDPELQSLLALLWRKTGDLSLTRLQLQERAATEYERAELHKTAAASAEPIYVPTGMYEYPSPVEELWRRLTEDVHDFDAALDYAAALEERGDSDYANAVRDVVVARGGGDYEIRRAAADRILGVREFRRPLTDDLRNRYLRPRSRRAALDALFHTAFHVLGPLIATREEDLDLRERDRLTRGSKLPVVRALRQTSAGVGFPRPPASFGHQGLGVRSANTLSPIVLIGPDRLASTDDGRLRFELGVVLSMMQPRFAFASMLGVGGLAAVAEALTGATLQASEAAEPETTERYRAFARASVEERWLEPLAETAARLRESVNPPDLDQWLEGVRAEAFRTWLVCAGDVSDALAAAEALTPAGDVEMERDLLMFAMSPECQKLREELGLVG